MAGSTPAEHDAVALAALGRVLDRGRQAGILEGLRLAENVLEDALAKVRAEIAKQNEPDASSTQDDAAAESLKYDLGQPIDVLGLMSRAHNQLHRNNILTVGDLIEKSENDLRDIGRFGPVTINDIKTNLTRMGLSLKDDEQA